MDRLVYWNETNMYSILAFEMVYDEHGLKWFKMCMFKSLGHGLGYGEWNEQGLKMA